MSALPSEAVHGNGKVLGNINLVVRRFVAEFRQRGSLLGKVSYMFASATDPTVADSILKSWRSLPRASQHPVTVRNCLLWEADLQRIANQETEAIPQALIDEQEVFRRMLLSSSGSEGRHRSGRLVKVRSNCQEFRGCLLITSRQSKRSRQYQTVAIAFVSSGRDVHVYSRLKVRTSESESSSHSPTRSRAFTARASSASLIGQFGQTRIVVALTVAGASCWRLRASDGCQLNCGRDATDAVSSHRETVSKPNTPDLSEGVQRQRKMRRRHYSAEVATLLVAMLLSSLRLTSEEVE